jgi:hypothetical protein
MRHTVVASIGVLLLVGGFGVGVLSKRYGVLDRCDAPDRPGDAPELAAGRESLTKHTTKKVRATLEQDGAALLGLWIQPRESGANPKILRFHKGSVKVCDLASLSPYAMFGIHFLLAEGGGERQMLDPENLDAEGRPVVLFTYHLDGDTLELKRVVKADYGDNYDYDLGGKWLRLHYRENAEQSAAANRRRE